MELQSILIYLFLLLALFLGSYNTTKHKTLFFLILSLIVYALIFGLRYGVGVDFYAYQEWYNDALDGIRSYDHIELGFRLLIEICAFLGLPSSFFFGIIAFLQLLLIFLSLRRFSDSYPFLAIVFILGAVWLSYANGLRQQLAFCVFAYSIKYIDSRSWVKYYTTIIIAMLLHTSAIILFLIYPIYIFTNEIFRNVKWQFLLLIGVFLLSNTDIVNGIASRMESVAHILNYDVYFSDNYELTHEVKKGLGYWINLSLSLCLILFSNEVKNYYNCRHVSIIYDMYYFGIVWRYVFISSHIFSRVNYYFAGFEYIFAALTLAYLWQRDDLRKYVLIILYVLIFIATMYRMHTNTALFMFNWQTSIL